jgi:hypothetical protein
MEWWPHRPRIPSLSPASYGRKQFLDASPVCPVMRNGWRFKLVWSGNSFDENELFDIEQNVGQVGPGVNLIIGWVLGCLVVDKRHRLRGFLVRG